MSGRAFANVSGAAKAAAVTPSDVTILPTTRGLYIGTGGDVAVVMADGGSAVTFSSVLAGFMPVQVTKVMSTNTTASNILALW